MYGIVVVLWDLYRYMYHNVAIPYRIPIVHAQKYYIKRAGNLQILDNTSVNGICYTL